MTTGLLMVLIFAVAYPVIALAVACVGIFGVAAGKHERWEAAETRALKRCESPLLGIGTVDRFTTVYYGDATRPLLLLATVCAAFWPVAVPLWLAWKKGDFINQALVKRAEVERSAA